MDDFGACHTSAFAARLGQPCTTVLRHRPACIMRKSCRVVMQTYALDTGIFIEELLRTKGVLARGLAHPVIFDGAGQRSFRSFMSTYGAVRVLLHALRPSVSHFGL